MQTRIDSARQKLSDSTKASAYVYIPYMFVHIDVVTVIRTVFCHTFLS